MADYKNSNVSGESYQRGKIMSFYNILNKPPVVKIEEEIIYNLADEIVVKPAGSILVEVTDLDKEFQLRNPITGELLESFVKYSDLYTMLYSLYWHLALERDNG